MENKKLFRLTMIIMDMTDYGKVFEEERDAIDAVRELDHVARINNFEVSYSYIEFYGFTPTGAMILTEPEEDEE